MKVTVLGKKELEQVLELPKVIDGVKSAYALKADGKTVVWPLVSYEFGKGTGDMDIRSGGVFGDENVHGLKMLNNFPGNNKKGLPAFTGMLMIFDSNTGLPMGVMDAAYITCMRTGSAGAIGAQALARKNASTLFVLGAGNQAAYQIAATLSIIPTINKVYIADPIAPENAVKFAQDCQLRMIAEFNINCEQRIVFDAVDDMAKCVGESDIIITVTPSREPVIKREWVKPGTHFSCIGADMEGKEEIDPELFKGARIFADDQPQCMRVGEMEIPLKSGVIKESDISGEIGQVLTGQIVGRQSDDEITIFDATGIALLDLVTGKRAIELANEKSIGTIVEL